MTEWIPVLAGLLGAVVGGLASITTLIIQFRYQTKREMTKMAFELAMDDYKFRLLNESERIRPAPIPVLLAYHDRMIDLLLNHKLTPEHAGEILEAQKEMSEAIYAKYRQT